MSFSKPVKRAASVFTGVFIYFNLLVGAHAEIFKSPFLDITEASSVIELHSIIDISELHAQIKSEEISCYKFVYAALLRIKNFDLNPRFVTPINAFTHLNENVLSDAKHLDEYFATYGELKGPLHCVTVAVKDNIAVDGLPINAGSRALLGTLAKKDAVVVDRLQEAGSVLIGLASMDELAKGISGISGLSGRTGNPFAPDFSMGGSSSGAAASVAAGFTMIGIGTDNCGSLTIPSSYGGLSTIRSSLDVLPLDGVMPVNLADQVVGPIARNAFDLKIVFNVLRGTPLNAVMPDSRSPENVRLEYQLSRLDSFGSNANTKVTSTHYLKNLISQDKILERNSERMRETGILMGQNTKLKDVSLERYYVGQASEMNDFLHEYTDYDRGFVAICRSDNASKFHRLGFLRCLARAARSRLFRNVGSFYDDDRLATYRQNAKAIREKLNALRSDAFMFPADANGHAQLFRSDMRPNCLLMSTSGVPAVTIFVGQVSVGMVKLPLSMLLVGPVGKDDKLLDMASHLEAVLPAWTPPELGSIDSGFVLDASWFKDQNAIRRALGRKIFNLILKDGDKGEVTAGRSRDALIEILQSQR